MSPSWAVLGLDLGSTGARGLIIGPELEALSKAKGRYPMPVRPDGRSEQDPERVWRAALSVLSSLSRAASRRGLRLRAVSLSGIWHTILPLDGKGRPLDNALTWADSRAVSEARKLADEFGAERLYRLTGCPPHPMYPPAKLLHMLRRSPTWRRARRFCALKDYVALKLTGRLLTDESTASGSGLLGLEGGFWAEELLSLLGIDVEALPPVCSPFAVAGEIRPSVRREAGLPRGVVLVLGGADGALGSVGAGAVGEGEFCVNLGTSGAARAFAGEPRLDERMGAWCYRFCRGAFVVGAAAHNAVLALDWAARRLFLSRDRRCVERLVEEALGAPVGAEGLTVVPLLAGERSPGWRADARAAVFGLSLGHTARHVARALLEGVMFRLRQCFEAVARTVGPPRRVKATGLLRHRPKLARMLAEVLNLPVEVPFEPETSALGAAIAALSSVEGVDFRELARRVEAEAAFEPDPKRAGKYEEAYRRFLRAYETARSW